MDNSIVQWCFLCYKQGFYISHSRSNGTLTHLMVQRQVGMQDMAKIEYCDWQNDCNWWYNSGLQRLAIDPANKLICNYFDNPNILLLSFSKVKLWWFSFSIVHWIFWILDPIIIVIQANLSQYQYNKYSINVWQI